MGAQQEKKIQIGFETKNAVITLEKDVDKLYGGFKKAIGTLLEADGFLCKWSDSVSEECDVVITIVQLDQGKKSLRSFLSWVPLMNPVICLFPATFEIEMTVWYTKRNQMSTFRCYECLSRQTDVFLRHTNHLIYTGASHAGKLSERS